MIRLVWSQLPLKAASQTAIDALKRSSNSVATVGKQLYVFGGERLPRQPVDNELWVVKFEDGTVSAAQTAASESSRPSPRVGAAMSYHANNDAIYLWGGRESHDMTPCNLTLWKYKLGPGEWSSVPTADKQNVAEGEKVVGRSYHAMCVSGDDLYLHAGCPATGRIASLHSLSLDSGSGSDHEWSSLPTSPEPARGGTVLAPITIPNSSTTVLVRYGGFAGYELGGQLDYFTPASGTWSSVRMPGEESTDGHPASRSVHALVPVQPPIPVPSDGHIVAIMLFGERGPAAAHLGHLGAGTFHRDAWALLCSPDAVSADNSHGFQFVELPQEGDGTGGIPPARGWFGADWASDLGGGGGRIVVHGGLDDQNERLGDVWVGKLEV
ncbi:kelch repeat protein [Mycena amicta]|nr:kelch repeat protein [Mycena amicta]